MTLKVKMGTFLGARVPKCKVKSVEGIYDSKLIDYFVVQNEMYRSAAK